MPSRHRRASPPEMMEVGGFFSDFGAVRIAFDGRCSAQALDRYVESNMTDSKELVELAKRGGLEMTQGSSVGTSPASARLRGDSVASVGLEFEHLMDLDAGLSGVPVVFDGPSPRRRTGSAGSASDGLGPAFAMDFEDPEGAAHGVR